MAKAELGLKVAFYAYPCVLFVTLLGVQSAQFYLSRHGNPQARHGALDADQKQRADKTRRIFARLIWTFQFILSLLLIASIVFTTKQVFANQGDVTGDVAFAFSAYLVSDLSSS